MRIVSPRVDSDGRLDHVVEVRLVVTFGVALLAIAFAVIVGGPSWTRDENGYLHTPDGLYVLCPKDGGYFGAHGNAFQVITPDLTINCAEA